MSALTSPEDPLRSPDEKTGLSISTCAGKCEAIWCRSAATMFGDFATTVLTQIGLPSSEVQQKARSGRRKVFQVKAVSRTVISCVWSSFNKLFSDAFI